MTCSHHTAETFADLGTAAAIASILTVFLKAMGFITWSWWAVLAPFYVGPLLCGVAVVCALIAVAVVYALILIANLLEKTF